MLEKYTKGHITKNNLVNNHTLIDRKNKIKANRNQEDQTRKKFNQED